MNDGFGDVYGIYYALTADEGFSYTDLRDWAQRIRTQLTPIEGVQKVMLYGEQTEVINVKISTHPTFARGIDPTSIMGILQKQNIQVNTGRYSDRNLSVALAYGRNLYQSGRYRKIS